MNPAIDLVAFEKDKIKGAIRTDFILSAEIIAITLGTVAAAPFGTRLAVLSAISAIMTVGVYGFVAGLVKLDDAGLHLSERASGLARGTGRAILATAPWLMKFLSIAGTVAMFLVGGGIITHGVPILAHLIERVAASAGDLPTAGMVLGPITPMVLNLAVALAVGTVIVGAVTLIKRVRSRR